MSCERVRKLIPLAVGNDLDAGRKRWVDHHVTSCLPCYREMREWAGVLAELDPVRAPGSAPAPEGLLESIMAEVAVAAPGPLAPHPTPLRTRAQRVGRYAVAFAAGFVVMATAGFHFLGTGAGGDISPARHPGIGGGAGGPGVRIQPVTYSPDDLTGAHRFVLPDGPSGKLRLVGPVPYERTESLPPARVVPVSQRNDF